MTAARPLPGLSPRKVGKFPTVADSVLPNGLRVLAVRRAGVPLAELRLRVPLAEPSGRRRGPAYLAQTQLLADTLLSGTERRSATQLAAQVQALGGQLSASTDADRLAIGGSVLLSGLPGLLELLADVLTGAAFPKHEVVGERDRLVQELAIHRSQASVIAREALLHRLYGDHPYGHEMPTAEQVREVKATHLRTLFGARVAPAGSVLTIVGDLTPSRAVALIEKALTSWTTSSVRSETPALPAYESRPALLLDRPGAVQTTVRLAAPAPARTAPDYAAASMANLVFGGYFCSRWVMNLREDKGYTYSPHAGIEHPPAGSRFSIAADVSTPTTAAAVVETLYELGRVATTSVTQDELDQARRYTIGSLALGTASQAGLASTLSMLAAAGLGVGWLRDYPALLAAVTRDDVQAAAARWLAPARFTGVLVGDVAQVEAPLAGVLPLERG